MVDSGPSPPIMPAVRMGVTQGYPRGLPGNNFPTLLNNLKKHPVHRSNRLPGSPRGAVQPRKTGPEASWASAGPWRSRHAATCTRKRNQRTLNQTPVTDNQCRRSEAVMVLRKACCLVVASGILTFAAVSTLKVSIREYTVPTPNSRPHDPAVAPDGSLWFTGQGANKIGRLDPGTGTFKEYALKTPEIGR